MTFLGKNISDDFSVSAQIFPDQILAIKKAGYKSVIINRPDGEGPDQPLAAEIVKLASEAGLEAVYIPMTPGQLPAELIAATADAFAALPKPILAYCASGTRCAMLWALVNAPKLGVDGVIYATSSWGYDLEQIRPLLEAIISKQK